ncbi:mRNA export factor Gle1 [Phlebotomus argentipes]|uniref:mRNA export factor Gle1 n=1 Tax=Phlebotomus argentipes TaxID=94469 RepID=UPI0028929983|nr:mRNA export factor Gle1 [Phlebotomus argentipes]
MSSKSSISFDVKPLEQTILSNAAKISPFIRETTIGPNARDCSIEEGIGGLAIAEDKSALVANKGEKNRRDSDGISAAQINLKEYFDDISHIRKRLSLEKERKEAIQKEVLSRMSRQKIQQTDLDAIYSESQKSLQRKLALLCEQTENRVKQTLEEQERQNQIQEERMREAMLASSKRIDSVQMKLKQVQEKQKMNSCIEALGKAQEKFVKCFETFAKTLLGVEKSLLPNYMAFNERAKPLMATYEQTIKSIEPRSMSEAAVRVIEGLVEDFQKLRQELVAKIASDAAEAEEAKQKAAQEVPKVKEKSPVDQTDAVRSVQGLNQFISPESQKQYTRVMSKLMDYSSEIEPLSRDDGMKKYRFNCQKAINIPVNAISGVSAAHLRDKHDKLATLLGGNPVPCGDEQVSAAAHPLGRRFCTVLLAKKFVNQADMMVASNPKAAFPIAAVIVALWQKFPDFGELFLANLYKDCPYLVPYFIPQFEGQSAEEYCHELGYKTINGAQEPQDMYLKRMAGIARLYAAVLVTKLRAGETQSHPHDLSHGWVWLCNILNMDPLPDICATILLEVLQTAGEELRRLYGRQFLKLIFAIQNQYFPKLKQVDEGGPSVRLEVLLAKVMQEGKFEQPEGILPPNFW